jgi:hypothetical protein
MYGSTTEVFQDRQTDEIGGVGGTKRYSSQYNGTDCEGLATPNAALKQETDGPHFAPEQLHFSALRLTSSSRGMV